jgi:peptide/nickel transport system substrate-binding protein
MSKHRLLVLGSALIVALGLVSYAAAGSKSAAKRAASGSITIALGNEPTTLDPLLQEDGNERWVTDSIYDTLMGRSNDGKKLYPKLAAAQPKLIKKDTWQFKLRPGIKFSDGQPMNADAVVYSVNHLIDPKYNSAQIEFVGTIKTAKKVNNLTVDIITKGPDPILPSRMYWVRILPAHPASDIASHPVGTGPYLFKEWARGDHITLTANPNYWGSPKPSIQTITYKFVPEEGAQLAGLVSGQYDLITHLLPDEVKRAPKAIVTNGNEHPMIILNARKGTKSVTGDVRVRQALNYAVDKNALAKNLFLGYAKPDAGQTLSPSWFGYDPKTKAYPYDPAKAKALIKAAGATGKTITLEGEAGRWLNDKVMIESVAQYWREAGLKVNVQIHDFNTYLKRLFDPKNRPDAIFVSTDNPLYDADRTVSAYYAPSGTGASNSDQQLQKWIDQARTTVNVKKRLGLYHKAVERANKQAYLLWLLNTKNVWGTSTRLVWTPRLDGFMFDNTMRLKG